MLITLNEITKTFSDELVLDKVSLSVGEEDRIGLLGVNGIGKSTLLNIIAGALPFDSGEISKKKDLKIGYHRQNEALNTDNTLEEEIRSVFSEIFLTRDRLSALSEELSKAAPQSEEYRELEKEYEEQSNKFAALDGYSAETRINKILNGLGFGDFNLKMKTASLSGGEKIRFSLAKLLLDSPELLLLDEPTNHLDFMMLEWLEDYLKNDFKGAVVVVSHDRYFLDSVAKDICEIECCEIHRYKGGYASFLKQKAEREKTLTREYEKQQEEIEKLQEYVRKNLARSSSSNSVGSRVKALEKLELKKKPNPRPKDIHFKFEYDIEPHKTVLTLKDVGITVGSGETQKKLSEGISLEVRSHEKIAIIGKNGVGKSSLIKAIMRRIPYNGRITFGGNVKAAYFDQELSDLDLNDTVIEAVHKKFPTKTDFEIRSAFGKLLIEDEAVFKRVRDLSGANRAKVQFLIIMFSRANLLILDEPTNHLDYIAKEALDNALKEYSGTLITVSHDRYFLNSVPDKIIELFENGTQIYNGNYDYYLSHRKQPAEIKKQAKADSQNKTNYNESKLNKAEERKRRARLNELTKLIDNLQSEIDVLEEKSVSPEAVSDYQLISELLGQIGEKKQELEAVEEEWLSLAED